MNTQYEVESHINVSLAEAAPDAGRGVEEREEVEGYEDCPPLVVPGVQVDCNQQLREEDGELEE